MDASAVVSWTVLSLALVVLIFWAIALVWALAAFRKFEQEYPKLKAETDAAWNIRKN